MPIDVTVPRSPGWWLQKCATRLQDPRRRRRLALLDSYRKGSPPLPANAQHCQEGFAHVLRMTRTNLAELISEAVRERMSPMGVRTSADGDETGDAEAWRIWQRAGLNLQSTSAHDDMLCLGEGFVIIGDVDPETGVPVITSEDPQQMVGIPDPARPGRLLAALKMFHDDLEGVDFAYLYLPGEVWVARADRRSLTSSVPSFSAQAWDWDLDRSGDLPPELASTLPVVWLPNKDGIGEYEKHLDLLDRINHTMLMRIVILVLQAHRQRAIEGLPEEDEDGEEIDYTDVFTSDPGALWKVPAGVKFWESAVGDISQVLAAVKSDVQLLSAVARTPIHTFLPDGANQTAEGAAAAKEGLVFRVVDRTDRVMEPWSIVMATAFRWMGDLDRADLSQISIIWRSPERRSLAERADAASKAGDIPWRTKMVEIWEFPPDQVDRMAVERAGDQALAAAFAVPAVTGGNA